MSASKKADAYETVEVITASDIKPLFDACFSSAPNGYQIAVPMLYGAPGIGKSSMIAQYAAKHGYALMDVRLAQIQPEFLAGIQYVAKNENESVSLKPAVVARVEQLRRDTGKPVLLIFDELTLAAQDTLSAALELILDKRSAGYPFPFDTRICCAANRTVDTASAMILDPPIRSRLCSVILEPTPEEVAAHLQATLPKSELLRCVVGWLNGSNAKAHFSRGRTIGDEAAFFTPRGLEQMLRLAAPYVATLDNLEKNRAAKIVATGSIGKVVWQGICAHAVIAATMRPALDILNNPRGGSLPNTTEAFVAQMGGVSQHIRSLKRKDRESALDKMADFVEAVAEHNAEMVRVWASGLSSTAREELCGKIKMQRILADCGYGAGIDISELARQAKG
jgi:hypothetical protein